MAVLLCTSDEASVHKFLVRACKGGFPAEEEYPFHDVRPEQKYEAFLLPFATQLAGRKLLLFGRFGRAVYAVRHPDTKRTSRSATTSGTRMFWRLEGFECLFLKRKSKMLQRNAEVKLEV
jgi:hypothetical protein